MKLSTQQIEQFHHDGYLVVKDLLPLDWVRGVKEELAGAHEIAYEAEGRTGKSPWGPGTNCSWEPHLDPEAAPRIEQLMGTEIVSPSTRRIIHSDRIADLLPQLMGPDAQIVMFHSKALMKAPRTNGYFPWHQDFSYWHQVSVAPVQVNCAFAVDPQTAENGCLKYVPGSHRGGFIPHTHFTDVKSFSIGLSRDPNAYEAIPVPYEPGDVIFFGALVIHGSEINRTGESATFNTIAYDVRGNATDREYPLVVPRTRAEAPLAR
ncbi:MAG: phytanoyl-CoA dioxygenase family protein [Spirochaetes bacterium]|nr:phytanoyl-CoA dioxygenase family protein [Spirochaetota bacterium]